MSTRTDTLRTALAAAPDRKIARAVFQAFLDADHRPTDDEVALGSTYCAQAIFEIDGGFEPIGEAAKRVVRGLK
jgi:hypothetical protein